MTTDDTGPPGPYAFTDSGLKEVEQAVSARVMP